jgi:putative endonuclease
MLRCSDRSYYTGMTGNIEQRLEQHRIGYFQRCYTYDRRPVECVYTAEFGEVLDAIAWEKQIKRWSRKKKEALIKDDEQTLRLLAECQNASHARNQ